MKPTSHNFSGATRARRAGFTMIEIAICLAVIGIALVAIVGVLPIGLNAQRESREATVVGQDATVLLEAIRSGARGLDDLTNYVIVITNFQTIYTSTNPGVMHVFTFTYNSATMDGGAFNNSQNFYLNNGYNIVGLLSTPLYVNTNAGNASVWNTNYVPVSAVADGVFSNHIVAYFHSLSGPVTEKPPQDNQLLTGDSFGYRVVLENAPMAVPTGVDRSRFTDQLSFNEHEVRLMFNWPILPNSVLPNTIHVGNANQPQTFRSTVPGQLFPDPNSFGPAGQPNLLYFYSSSSFVSTNSYP